MDILNGKMIMTGQTLYNVGSYYYAGIRQTGRPKKTWWDCVKNDMESLGLSQRMCSPGINGEGELRGQLANPGSPGKMAVKMECVCFQLSWKTSDANAFG